MRADLVRREMAHAKYEKTRDALGNNETPEQRAAYNAALERMSRYWDLDDARGHHSRMVWKHGHGHKLTEQASAKIDECLARTY